MSSSNTVTVELSSLSNEEQAEFRTQKMKMFKLTVAICAVYGSVAFFSLIIILLTSWGKRVLYNDMFWFFVTFIIGTVIIIIFMANEIHNFQPTKPKITTTYDSEMCPDYWKLENINDKSFVDDKGKGYFNGKMNKNHFKYKCTLDTAIFDPTKLQAYDNDKKDSQKKNYKIGNQGKLYTNLDDKVKTGIKDDSQYEAFKTHAANMNGYTYANDSLSPNNSLALSDKNETFNSQKVPMACDTVYPMYLSMMDSENVKKNPSEPSNRYRCAYAKACGMSWTEAGCST